MRAGSLRRLLASCALVLASPAVAHAQGAKADGALVPPTVIEHVDAAYPASAVASGKHADVVLFVTIDVDGHVANIEVAQSGGRELDEAAMAAMHGWTFHPATRGGEPVASRIRVPFHFAPPAPPPEGPTGGIPAGSIQGGVTSGASVGASSPSPDAVAGSTSPVATEVSEEVRVHGRQEPVSHGASDYRVQVGKLAEVPRHNASEMLKLAPGIMLSNEGGEGHAEQVFLRGFDAREGQDIEFTVGGVPINESGNLHGNGYADTHFIIPELVESLRVVEGPFDPRQGNYAVAGSADYQLGLSKRGFTVKGTVGTFDTQRLLMLWGPKGESDRTFGGAEIYKTDGYGQNRDATRATAMGQYEGRFGQRGSYRVTATAYSTHYHSAGVLREDDFRAGRIHFYDSYDDSSFAREQTPEGGDSSRFSLAADIESRTKDATFSQQIFAIKRDMRLLENFTGFLLDVQEPLQSLHAQRGDMLDLTSNELTVGARGAAKLHTQALGQKQELELGYFARGDKVQGEQQRIEANTGHPYATETNLDSDLGDIGLYGDANLAATKWLSLRGGARADLFTYDVQDACAAHDVSHPSAVNPPIDQSCLDQQDFGRPRQPNQRSSTASTALLPRASLVLGPFSHLSFTTSYGQGVRSVDPGYISQDVKTPFASVVAYEGGAAYAGAVKDNSIVVRSVFFQTHVDKDLVFSETAGRNVLGNGTTRTGWSGSGRVTGSFFDESANVTFVRSSYDDTHLLVAYVPDVVLRSDTALFTELPIRIEGQRVRGTLGTGLTYVGPRALPFGQRSQDTFTLDASATLTWTHYELGLLATNLTDRRNRLGEYNYASDFHSQAQPTLVPQRHFTAGAPREVFATFAVNFGGT